MIFINFPTKGLEGLSLKALETELYKGFMLWRLHNIRLQN